MNGKKFNKICIMYLLIQIMITKSHKLNTAKIIQKWLVMMTSNSFKKSLTMMILKSPLMILKFLKGSLMQKSTIMVLKQFKKFHNDGTEKFKKIP